MKENNVPGLGNPDDAQLRRTACTPESQIEQDLGFYIHRGAAKEGKVYVCTIGKVSEKETCDIEGKNLNYCDAGTHHGVQCNHVGGTEQHKRIIKLCAKIRESILEIHLLNQGEDEAQRQRIVETEAQPENTAPTTKYPIGGFAPGNYLKNCVTCSEQFVGDKLARQCEPCAIETTTKIPNPTTQQDKPVLSGEVYRWVMASDKPLPKLALKQRLSVKFNGYPDTVINHDGKLYWFNGTNEEDREHLVSDKDLPKMEFLEPISLPAPVQDVEQLRQIFLNNFNCYAESEKVIPAMDVECFISVVAELPQSLSKQSAPLQDVEELDKELSFMWAEDIAVGFCSFMNKNYYGKKATKYHYELYAQSLQHRGEGLGSRGQ